MLVFVIWISLSNLTDLFEGDKVTFPSIQESIEEEEEVLKGAILRR